MRLGPVNGTVQEVRDLLENNGLKLEDYLEKPPAALRTRYLVIPAILLLSMLTLIVALRSTSAEIVTLNFLLAFAAGLWLTASIQLRFKNILATFVVAVGALLMILVAAGIFSPKDSAEFLKGLNKGK